MPHKNLYGRSSFALFTPGSGGESIDMGACMSMDDDIGPDIQDTTPLGDDWERTDCGGWSGRFKMTVDVENDTPAQVTVPTGVEGTLKIGKDYRSQNTGYITGSVLFSKRFHVVKRQSPGGGGQQYLYLGRWTGPITEVK